MGSSISTAISAAPCCATRGDEQQTPRAVLPLAEAEEVDNLERKRLATLSDRRLKELKTEPLTEEQRQIVKGSAQNTSSGTVARVPNGSAPHDRGRALFESRQKKAAEQEAAPKPTPQAKGSQSIEQSSGENIERSATGCAEAGGCRSAEQTRVVTGEQIVTPTKPIVIESVSSGNRGRDLFEKRKQKAQEQEAADIRKAAQQAIDSPGQAQDENRDSPVRPPTSILGKPFVSVQKLAQAKWRLHGLHEDLMVKLGIAALDANRSTEGLMAFPRRKNGTSMLFREAFMKSLMTGDRDLKSTHESDVSSAQGDVKQLSLRQLLKLRTSCLDYEPHRQDTSSAQASFLQSLDWALFEQLARQGLGNRSSQLDTQSLRKFGFQLCLLTAAADSLASSDSCLVDGLPIPTCWAWWLQQERVFFHISEFSCTTDFPQCGVVAIQDLSRPDGQRRQIDWNAKYFATSDELIEFDDNMPQTGAQGGSFISLNQLQDTLGSLKKVPAKRQ